MAICTLHVEFQHNLLLAAKLRLFKLGTYERKKEECGTVLCGYISKEANGNGTYTHNIMLSLHIQIRLQVG